MRKFLFAITFSVFLTLSFVSFQKVSSQIKKDDYQKKTEEHNSLEINDIDDSDQYSSKWLRNDLRLADVVAYVDVKEVKFSGHSDEMTDCENNTGGGYCGYLLIAEVKEVFKGKIETKLFEFYDSADATYPKKYFLGEKIVFLMRGEENENKQKTLGAMDNSSRLIEQNVLEKMRNILNPQSSIDENDEREPYSRTYIKKNFEEADAVIYANVLSFEPDSSNVFGNKPFLLKAKIKEVFKGNLKAGQTFEYKDDLLYRPMREEDLGEQILYLKRTEEAGKVVYEKVDYTEGWIEHDILEKLRKIAKENSNGKD